jgi:hypothetical protein
VAGIHLVLEIESGDRIAGWLVPERGPRERFEGLLEMVTAVDRLRRASAEDETGVPDRPKQ